jgi:hypothetical protein
MASRYTPPYTAQMVRMETALDDQTSPTCISRSSPSVCNCTILSQTLGCLDSCAIQANITDYRNLVSVYLVSRYLPTGLESSELGVLFCKVTISIYVIQHDGTLWEVEHRWEQVALAEALQLRRQYYAWRVGTCKFKRANLEMAFTPRF